MVDPNFSRLVSVVIKFGRDVCETVFLNRVPDLTPNDWPHKPWTVDEFLHENRTQMERLYVIRRNTKFLYPKFGVGTKHENWDITLLFALLQFCQLKNNVRKQLEKLRVLRNTMFHEREPTLSDDEFEMKVKRFQKIVEKITEKEDCERILKEMKQYIDDRTHDPEHIKICKDWNEIDDDRVKVAITQESEDLDRLVTVIKNMKFKCEGDTLPAGLVLSFSLGVRVRGDDQTAEEALQSHGENTSTYEKEMTVIIDMAKADMQDLGTDVEYYASSSILFNVTCFSITSLIHVINYWTGPIAGRRIKDMEAILENDTKDTVDLEVFVPPEASKRVQETIENHMRLGTSRNGPYQSPRKVFNDHIHGQIELHPLCVKIVDTPQFQRLRHIRQLDTCYFVYPSASHNRFEHSIGTCHLAGRLLRHLKERQPELNITTKDILCVEIAALCHDMGQGPFSHVFEAKFLPEAYKEKQDWKKWTHEEAAVQMFKYMLEDNDRQLYKDFKVLMPAFEERDIEFIEEMIGEAMDTAAEIWPYKGRFKSKSFLYEVVANAENGIDVDKWDYLSRDSLMLGMKTNFDHDRCIKNARVLMADGRNQICYRDKSSQDLYDMFYTRMTLHRRAYQHKTHNIIGIMIRDALLKANETFLIQGDENRSQRKLSETIDDMTAYTYLTDDILQQILRSPDESLAESKDIIKRINKRNLYKCVTQTQVDIKKSGWITKAAVQENLFNQIRQFETGEENIEEIIEIDVVTLHYGMKGEDPVKKVWFYRKGDMNKAFRISKEQVSYVLPDTFAEQYVRVYCSREDVNLFNIIEKAFSNWCKENNLPLPKGYYTSEEQSEEFN